MDKVNEKLLKPYNPKETEGRIYKLWEESGYFNPDKLPERNGQTFYHCPASAQCHRHFACGARFKRHHSRYSYPAKRMQGYKTLWIPGTDHAGIATQNVVEKI